MNYKLNIFTSFLYPGQDHIERQSETVNGDVMRDGNRLTIEYQGTEGLAKIICDGDDVTLINGLSRLHLKKDEEVLNDYQTEFGEISVKAFLVRIHHGESRLRLTYILSQDDPFVRVTIRINWHESDHVLLH